MLNKSVICLSLIIITSFLTTPALCLDAYQRARQAMELYSAAQLHWQSNLAELVSTKNQSFADLAIIQRNLQLSLISLRNERFQYLLQKDPKRLTLDKGISKLANFEWSDKDSKTLSMQSPSYAKREKRTEELERTNNAQAEWPEFRMFFRESLANTPQYKKLLDELLEAQKVASELLNQGQQE